MTKEEYRRPYPQPKANNNWVKYVVLVYLGFIVLFIVLSHLPEETETENPVETIVQEEMPVQPVEEKTALPRKPVARPKSTTDAVAKPVAPATKLEPKAIEEPLQPQPTTVTNTGTSASKKTKSTLEILEEKNRASVIEQAKEAGVSTEGSTLEILERINRKILENL